MPVKTSLWHSLEALATPAAVMAEWQTLMGSDFGRASPFLRPTSRQAGTYPCTNTPRCRCWHDIHPLDGDTLIARCGCRLGNCAPIRITPAQAAIHELDTSRLAPAIQHALKLDEPPRGALQSAPDNYFVGTHGPEQHPAVLCLAQTEPALGTQVPGLVASMPNPFILLTPTGVHVSQNIDAALRRHRSVHLPLSRFLAVAGRGTLSVTRDPTAALARLSQDPVAAHAARRPTYALRRDDKIWNVVFASGAGGISDCKGMRYVAYLLTHPAERPLHAIDLVGRATMTAAPTTTAETTDPDTGQPIQVQVGARTQDRSHSLDDAVVAQRIRAKEQEWEAVLDDPDATEPEKAEAERYLVELHEFQKKNSSRSRSSADKLVRAVRANITRLHAQLAKATDEHRKPHQVLRAFAEHIAKYIIAPSARYSGSVRSTARSGLAGRFTYEPPPGVNWSE
jgi:hypothetical protein